MIYSRESGPGMSGLVKVYHLRSGECVASISSGIAMRDVASIHFHEESHTLYTGHESGKLMRWGN